MKALKDYEKQERKQDEEIKRHLGRSFLLKEQEDSEEEWTKFGNLAEQYNREHGNERIKQIEGQAQLLNSKQIEKQQAKITKNGKRVITLINS